MIFQSKYSYDSTNISGMAFDQAHEDATGYPVASMTLQQFKDEADINMLLARFAQTGSYYDPASIAANASSRQAMYGDYSDLPTYQEAQQIVIESEAMFDALPSSIRARFGNDPANLLDFVNNPDNVDEAIKLGLLSAPALEEEPINPVPETPQVAE